jgi:hypothetical protein
VNTVEEHSIEDFGPFWIFLELALISAAMVGESEVSSFLVLTIVVLFFKLKKYLIRYLIIGLI